MEIFEQNGQLFARISRNKRIYDAEEAIEMMMNAYYQDANVVLICKESFPRAFYDLKTKLAGDILQKFSTYNMRLGIIGDFKNVTGQSLSDFIRESNRGNRICFVATETDAIDFFSK